MANIMFDIRFRARSQKPKARSQKHKAQGVWIGEHLKDVIYIYTYTYSKYYINILKAKAI